MEKPLIMIVDDEPDNLNILDYMLNREGYKIAAFPRGDLALKSAMNKQPDLVLLDIRMPDMDGYSLCKLFKEKDLLKDIPIIFISALDDIKDKVYAFDVGGIDYITKPFNEKEVLSRVKTHVQLRQHQQNLEELVKQRTQELSEAYKRLKIWDEAKDNWLSFLAHEIRTPLNGIFGAMQIILENDQSDSNDEMKKIFDNSMKRVQTLVDDALLLIKINVNSNNYKYHLIKNSILRILKNVIHDIKEKVSDIPIEVINEKNIDINLIANDSLITKALHDLIFVTTKCLKPGQRIQIKLKKENNLQFIIISANGNCLKKDDLDTFFYTFGQRTLFKGSGEFGLNPILSKSIIKLYDGTVEIRNKEDNSGFIIEVCFQEQS